MEIRIVEEIIKKRLEDETRGIEREVYINDEMKEVLEKNFDEKFSKNIPIYYHILAYFEDNNLNIIPIKKVSVIEKDKIKIFGIEKKAERASLMSVRFFGLDFGKTIKFFSIPISKMRGWQFYGKLVPLKNQNASILEVDEICCAVSGKKLQEKIGRYRRKLIRGILNFFFKISGKVSINVILSTLRKYGVWIDPNLKIYGSFETMKEEEFNALLTELLSSYEKIYGRMALTVTLLLESLSESLRTKPLSTWGEKI